MRNEMEIEEMKLKTTDPSYIKESEFEEREMCDIHIILDNFPENFVDLDENEDIPDDDLEEISRELEKYHPHFDCIYSYQYRGEIGNSCYIKLVTLHDYMKSDVSVNFVFGRIIKDKNEFYELSDVELKKFLRNKYSSTDVEIDYEIYDEVVEI